MVNQISEKLALSTRQVSRTLTLLDEGASVPFLARYRKEATGNLDEEKIRRIRDTAAGLRELEKRREAVLRSVREQDKLTVDLEKAIRNAPTLAQLEDIYLPFRPKKRTRGMAAAEKGLEPLAENLLRGTGGNTVGQLLRTAEGFVDPEHEVTTPEEALAGARDIIAERISENPSVRKALRRLFREEAVLTSKAVKKKSSAEGAQKYRDYFGWSEPARKAPSHRVLAVIRASAEGYVTLHILPEEETAVRITEQTARKEMKFAADPGACLEQVEMSITDSYKRLLAPALENEIKKELKSRADEAAVTVFAENLRELLLAPPLGSKAVMGIDPGQRTGCKVVCLDKEGNLIHNTTVYPLPPHNKTDEAAETIGALVRRFQIEAVAVGNGTGGRETLDFMKSLDLSDREGGGPVLVSVDESGASIYSASPAAREEFPDHDVTVRGAVSIARRLMDPLAELVKIDPKSIGVGQYQHDVDQKLLKKSLDDIVVSCVNRVGVELNSASKQLLSYVSGLSSKTAENIVSYRRSHGPFPDRGSLSSVTGFGPKTFEQSAGFLRIRGGTNPLDASGVHPERYGIVECIAADLNVTLTELVGNEALCGTIDPSPYVDEHTGLPTLTDILDELKKPGRDPRETFKPFQFKDDIRQIEDLREGMVLPGIVTNVTNFGAFVDIGVHQDGLVHISELADHFVSNPRDIVKVHQQVTVTVISIDAKRRRIGLSMK